MVPFLSPSLSPRPSLPPSLPPLSQIHDWQSVYQSTTIPIPRYRPVDSSVTFIGRLAREILRITDTRTTTYIDQMSAWYDKRTTTEVVNIKLWEQLKVTT